MSNLFGGLFEASQRAKRERLQAKKAAERKLALDKAAEAKAKLEASAKSSKSSDKDAGKRKERSDEEHGHEWTSEEPPKKKSKFSEINGLSAKSPSKQSSHVASIISKASKKKKKDDSLSESEERQDSDGSVMEFGSEDEVDDRLIEELQNIIDTGDLPEGDGEDDEDNGNNDGRSSDGESSEEKKQQKGRSAAAAAAGVGGSVRGSSSASASGSSSRRREESEPTQTEIHSVFIGNLLPNISREELSDLVKKIEEPTQVRILMQDRNGRKVAVAFLDFTKASTVNTIVKKFNNSDFKGRKLQVRPANDRKLAPAPVSSESVYIRNLSFETTEDTLRKLFSPFGEILQIRLPVFADSGKHRGYGFIDYKDSSSAKKALKLDRKKVDGRPIIVEPAEKREAQKVDSLRKSDWEGEHLSFDD
jgi:nucleolin